MYEVFEEFDTDLFDVLYEATALVSVLYESFVLEFELVDDLLELSVSLLVMFLVLLLFATFELFEVSLFELLFVELSVFE